MTLDDVLWIDLTWKQTVARCFMYANTWYEGRDAIVSMRFLYYAIPRPVKNLIGDAGPSIEIIRSLWPSSF